MKRILVLGVLATLVAVPAASGRSAGTLYTGKVGGVSGSEVLVKVQQSEGKPYVSRFAAKNFEVACDDGVIVTVDKATLKGRILIGNRGGFHEKNDNGATTYNVRGGVDGSKIKGTLRYSGSIPDGNGVVRECDSGTLAFKAR